MSLAFTQEVLAAGFVDTSKQVIPIVTGGALIGGICAKALARVPQGKMGVRTRMEKATRSQDKKCRIRNKLGLPIPDRYREGALYGTTGPGIKLIFPFTNGIKPVSVQDRPLNFEPIQINKDGKKYDISASIIWAVKKDVDNPYKALFEIQEDMLDDGVRDICLAGLRTVLTASETFQDMTNESLVSDGVKKHCNEQLSAWGSEVRQVNLLSFSESDASMDLRGAMAQAAALGQVANELNRISLALNPPPFDSGLHTVPDAG